MEKDNTVLYREIQRPRQIWIWILILTVACFFWYIFIQQIFLGNPIGTKPAPDLMLIIFWLIFGILFPVVLIGFVKLISEVRLDGIYIRFQPFHIQYRKFLFKDIQYYVPVEYKASDFGGRGVRINLKGETAYSMNGKHAIKLKLQHETIVISTEKQEELLAAIQSVEKDD